MPETSYSYSISADFPGGSINESKLKTEIDASAIVSVLNRIDTTGDTAYIVFDSALSPTDKTILDGDTTSPAGGLIADHDNTPYVVSSYTETVYPRVDNTKLTTWKTMLKYNINGTARVMNSVRVMSYVESGATSYGIRIYDSTNRAIIAERTFTNTTEQLNDITTLSNIPTNVATIEFQLKVTGNGSKKAFIDSILIGIA